MLHVDPPAGYHPTGTRHWIEALSSAGAHIQHHHHMRMHTTDPEYDRLHLRSDFLRMVRWLTQSSVGLVLSGGGAKGIGHLAVLRAMEAERIPVDMICGTSMGALVAGVYSVYAHRTSLFDMTPPLKRCAHAMNSLWRNLMDLTIPITSLLTGHGFNRNIAYTLGAHRIEDLWLPYFCITTDLAKSQEMVHRSGMLWRYVRGSMSLVGYLPPICDKDSATGDTLYLVDGGYMNNFPADVMKTQLGAGLVIGVNAGADTHIGGDDYGESLSGWQILLRRFNPWGKKWNVPNSSDVNSQLVYVSSVKQQDDAVRDHTDLYLRMPVTQFGTLEWDAWSKIEAVSEPYATSEIRAWKTKMLAAQDERTRTWDVAARERRRGDNHAGSSIPDSVRIRRRRAASMDNLQAAHSPGGSRP